jgi:O-antigen/teichoic acid export membrane protein
MPAQILLAFSQQSPVVFVATLFDASTAGQFGLAFTVLALPLLLLGGSVGKALYGEAASIGMRHPEQLRRLVKLTQIRLFAFASLPAAVLFFFGPDLFGLAFGQSWRMAGHFASILAVYLLFQFTSAPLMQMLNLLDLQHIFLGLNLIRACSLAVIFLTVKTAQLSSIVFVWSFAVFGAAFYICLSLWIVKRLGTARTF